MQREPRAYLADIIAACDAIALDVNGVDVDAYLEARTIRSAVEREFIIIGEAVNILGTLEPKVFERITQARNIVDFRNQLTHGYMTVNDKLVWAYAVRNAPRLRAECAVLLAEMDDHAALEETSYLLRSPKNARRLLESTERLEAGEGTERDSIE